MMNATEELTVPTDNLSVICRLCLAVNQKLFQLFRSDELETLAIPLSLKVAMCTAIKVS